MTQTLQDKDYSVFLTELKARIQAVQIKAAMAVNSELIGLYWELAEKIVAKQKESQWGDGLLTRMSKDLQTEFPDMKGFSKRNLELMRQWYQFWKEGDAVVQQFITQNLIGQQFVAKLEKNQQMGVAAGFAKQLVLQIPWGHNLLLMSKSKSHKSEYQITRALPDTLRSSLPAIKEIKAELGGGE